MMQNQIIDNRVGEPDTDLIPPHVLLRNANFPAELTNLKPELGYSLDRPGLPRCLDAIANDFNLRIGEKLITRDNVILASGARGAMTSAVLRVIGKTRRTGFAFQPKVLLLEPGYNLFATQYQGFGCELEHVKINDAADEEKLNRIKAKLSHEFLFLPICSPNNPDGHIYSEYFLSGILKLMEEFPHLHIIYDAIYVPIVRQPNTTVPNIFALADEKLRSRIYVIDALSKSYAYPGARAGWLIAHPAQQIDDIQKYKDAQLGSLPYETQMKIIAALEFTPRLMPNYFAEVNRVYNKRLELVHNKLRQISGFHSQIPAGSFYYWADFANLSIDVKEMVLSLEKERHILLSYGSKFGEPHCIRINCGAKVKELSIICDAIVEFCRTRQLQIVQTKILPNANDSPYWAAN